MRRILKNKLSPLRVKFELLGQWKHFFYLANIMRKLGYIVGMALAFVIQAVQQPFSIAKHRLASSLPECGIAYISSCPSSSHPLRNNFCELIRLKINLESSSHSNNIGACDLVDYREGVNYHKFSYIHYNITL